MALSLLSLLCSVNEHYILLIIHRLQSRVYTLQVNNSKNSNLFAYLGITLCLRVPTRSSAVAKRPRDASCLSVVSIVASIVQYLKRSFFIISYFSFGFTSAYNSILFCCLRRNVYRDCWSLSRWRTTETVTLSRMALGGRILPAVYDQRYNCHNLRYGGRRPPATMFITPRLLQRQQQAYRLRIAISAYPTCIRRPR